MKALVLESASHLEFREVPNPRVRQDDVLVRVKACAICGSDVHGMDGRTGRRIPPLIMGHEASGIVAEVGSSVKEWRVGDAVTFDSMIYCGKCYFCRQGLTDLCDSGRVLGVSCAAYCQDGAMAEYISVPRHILYRLPEGLSFVHAALAEPLCVVVHALERGPAVLNKTAVVVGTGTIGLLLIQILRVAGCKKIVAIDLNADRLSMARQLGADVTMMANEPDLHARIAQQTDHGGADVAFEAVGVVETVDLAISSLRKGGSLTLVGNLVSSVQFPLQKVVTRELTLYGSVSTRAKYEEALGMMASELIDVETLISAVAPLCEGASWLARLQAGTEQLLKVVLEP